MKKTPLKHTQGFTLIEIMVVIVILGVLAALVVPNILGRPDEARVSAAKSDIKAISNALNLYKLDNFNYPQHRPRPAGTGHQTRWLTGSEKLESRRLPT
ncbi:General secretion pathway protein G [gamma proteobacterium IMCC2047]|nr:General secretion pathway protein G [gamma proteobacterium IMCC2047]